MELGSSSASRKAVQSKATETPTGRQQGGGNKSDNKGLEKEFGKLLDKTSKLMASITKNNKDKAVKKVMSMKGTKKSESTKGTKLQTVPQKSIGRGDSSRGVLTPPTKILGETKNKGDKIDKGGVQKNLKKIHDNISNLLKSKKFRNNFLVNYNKI